MLKFNWRMRLLNFKWLSYVWLIYLPYTILEYLPVRQTSDVFWLGMILLFLICYVLVVEIPHWQIVTMPLELLLTAVFAIFAFNYYMIIFPAWQFAFILLRRPVNRFSLFLTSYYLILGLGLGRLYLIHPQSFKLYWQNWFLNSLLFTLISPLLSYLLARSVLNQQQLHQTNRRLQAIIQRGERERIARDLHDSLGQSFSMITIKTELAKKLLVQAPEKVASELDDIEQTSRANLQMVRSIVNDLHQQSLSEALLDSSEKLQTVKVALITEGEAAAAKWPTKVQHLFSATMTEAFTNIIRHAGAHEVAVAFGITPGFYVVTIQDDGQGGDYHRENTNGLTGMSSRMAAAGGTFAIMQNHIGTQVTLTLPKELS